MGNMGTAEWNSSSSNPVLRCSQMCQRRNGESCNIHLKEQQDLEVGPEPRRKLQSQLRAPVGSKGNHHSTLHIREGGWEKRRNSFCSTNCNWLALERHWLAPETAASGHSAGEKVAREQVQMAEKLTEQSHTSGLLYHVC